MSVYYKILFAQSFNFLLFLGDHLYCQSCRHLNQVAKDSQEVVRRQAMAKRQAELKKANEEKDFKIRRLEERQLELNLIVAQQEAQLQVARAARAPFEDEFDATLSRHVDGNNK